MANHGVEEGVHLKKYRLKVALRVKIECLEVMYNATYQANTYQVMVKCECDMCSFYKICVYISQNIFVS